MHFLNEQFSRINLLTSVKKNSGNGITSNVCILFQQMKDWIISSIDSILLYSVLNPFCIVAKQPERCFFFLLTDRLRVFWFFSIGITRLFFCFVFFPIYIFYPWQWFVVYFHLQITCRFFYRKGSYLIFIYTHTHTHTNIYIYIYIYIYELFRNE